MSEPEYFEWLGMHLYQHGFTLRAYKAGFLCCGSYVTADLAAMCVYNQAQDPKPTLAQILEAIHFLAKIVAREEDWNKFSYGVGRYVHEFVRPDEYSAFKIEDLFFKLREAQILPYWKLTHIGLRNALNAKLIKRKDGIYIKGYKLLNERVPILRKEVQV